jgi:4-hydroxy 2-oxovalerate aldolase
MAEPKEHTEVVEARGDWVTYRPELKLLDCTVRDGGLMNNHHFEDAFVKNVYHALVAAGVDYMEIGYKGSKDIYPPDEYGPWKYCDEEDIRRVVDDNPTDMKLSAMADAERCDYRKDIIPADDSVLDAIRVACYVHQIPTAMDMLNDAHEKGYEVMAQLMAVSAIRDKELEVALETLADSPATTIYVVDSWGSLYSEQVRYLTKKYMGHCEPRGKQVGYHGHNNQQLAYANTIEAIILGANRVDGTMYGMGRGAGNCPLELLINLLKNPKFQLRPVIKCIQEQVKPLHKKLRWGPEIPYMITGQLNEHPRAAMEFLAGKDADNYVAFYDQILEEE